MQKLTPPQASLLLQLATLEPEQTKRLIDGVSIPAAMVLIKLGLVKTKLNAISLTEKGRDTVERILTAHLCPQE